MDCFNEIGFPAQYINFIQRMYWKPRSSIIINGRRQVPIEIQSGVRQGDPLAGFLYIVSIEMLGIAINSDRDIIGCKSAGIHKKLNLHCDDTAIFAKNTSAFNKVINVLDIFKKA